MKKLSLNLITAIVSLSLLTIPSYASGSSGGGGGSSGGGGGGGGGGGSFGGFGKVPAKKKNIDQELFQEGQAILTGKAEIKEEMSSRFTFLDQERKLKSSQKKMTKAAAANANKIDVEKLAGKLTSEQFKALNYYIDVRYLNPKDYSQKGKGKGKKKKK